MISPKTSCRPILSAGLAILVFYATPTQASLEWTGAGDGISLYQEANWLDDNGLVPAAGGVDPNTALTAATGGLVEIVGGTGTPSNYGGTFVMPSGDSLTVSNGKVLASGGSGITGGGAGSVLTVSGGASVGTGGLTNFEDVVVDNGTIDLAGTAGIAFLSGPSTFSISNGSSVITQFVNIGVDITVDGTSSIEFLGGGDPINSQSGDVTVNLLTGAQLTLVSEAELDEHIAQGEIFSNGTQVTAANRDTLLSVVGGTATALVPVAEPFALSAAQATPTVLRGAGTVRVHWRSVSATTIVVNDGSSDVASFSVGVDGQEFLDAGFVDLAVTSTTSFTVTASDGVDSADLATTVDVLAPGDPATYAEAVLADSPVAYWQFEEGAGSSAVFDSTNNGHDSLELVGGIASGAEGAVNGAISNDGTGGILVDLQLNPQDPDGDDGASDADPDDMEGWSIEAIVRPDSATTAFDLHIAANRDGNGVGRSNFFIDEVGTLASFVGGATRPGTNPLRDASWCHVVMTVALDPAAADPLAPYTIRYYIDGVLDTELPDVPIESGDGDWVLAAHKTIVSAGFLVGSLDEVSIYDRTLDQATITAHYDAFIADPGVAPLLGFDGLADSVVLGNSVDLVWKLGSTANTAVLTDDQGGTVVADATAVGAVSVSPTTDTTYTLTVNGTLVGTVTVTVEIPILITSQGINGGGFFQLTAEQLQEGASYDLFFSADLVTWTPVAAPQVAGADGILTFVDSVPFDPAFDPELYYRVERLP